MPGRFYELNIHYGVFVGGMGDFNEIFLGNQKNFRGCIENVFFNGLDVMVKAEDQASAIGDAKVLYCTVYIGEQGRPEASLIV